MNVQGPGFPFNRIAPTPVPVRPAVPAPRTGAPAPVAQESSFLDLLTAEERDSSPSRPRSGRSPTGRAPGAPTRRRARSASAST